MGFSPQISNFPSQQGSPPSRIYCQKSNLCIFNLIDQFSNHFLSASASCYFSNLLWLYIYIYILWGPKNGLQQMPPLYNAYGAEVLRSKFYKDKQNWSSETNLLKTWLIWNPVFTTIPFNRKLTIKTTCNLVILRSRSSDPLNSIFDWVNLKSHLAIPFNKK